MFASLKTINEFLPPSSKLNLFILFEELFIIFFPTNVDPVKEIMFIFLLLVNKVPTFGPVPVTKLTSPSGKSVFFIMFIKYIKDWEAYSLGFMITELPAASIKGSLSLITTKGKFQGIIKVTIPTGSKLTIARCFAPNFFLKLLFYTTKGQILTW